MGTLTLADREFQIGEPNVLHLTRMLSVIGRVGARAEKVTTELGQGLLRQVLPDNAESPPPAPLTASLFPFLAVLTPEDLLILLAALLQFDNEPEGVRWLQKHPPQLGDVVQILSLNLQYAEGITAALQNFTMMLGGLNLAGRRVSQSGAPG